MVLTEAQVVALERARQDNEAHGEFESECPGYCAAQDTSYVGTLKGVGRVYQRTCIDTYSQVAFAKLYDRKTPITAADLLNDRVVPFFDEHEVKLRRVLTDRGTEYCGTSQAHDTAFDRRRAKSNFHRRSLIRGRPKLHRNFHHVDGHYPTDSASGSPPASNSAAGMVLASHWEAA